MALATLAAGVIATWPVTPRPTSVTADATNPRNVLVHVHGKDEPAVEIRMAEGAPTLLEFPAGDRVELVIPGDGATVDVELGPLNDHIVVLRAGRDFPTAVARRDAEWAARFKIEAVLQKGDEETSADAEVADGDSSTSATSHTAHTTDCPAAGMDEETLAMDAQFHEDARASAEGSEAAALVDESPAVVFKLTVRLRSGRVLTFYVVAASSVANSTDRCIVDYDPAEVAGSGRAAGSAAAAAPTLGN